MTKILIVDDNSDNAEALSRVLRQSGHEVVAAPDGREALREVIQNLPDVVLLDLWMPEMDGPSFLEVARSCLRLRSLPVVVLTAFSESPMIDRVRNLKVNAILVKGNASPAEIQAALEEAVVCVPN